DLQTTAYKQWWSNKGKNVAHNVRKLADKQRKEDWQTPLTPFGEHILEQLYHAVQGLPSDESLLYEQLGLLVPPASEPLVWVQLLQRFASLKYHKAYHAWWTAQGKKLFTDLYPLTVAPNAPSQLAEAFRTFVATAFEQLVNAASMNNE